MAEYTIDKIKYGGNTFKLQDNVSGYEPKANWYGTSNSGVTSTTKNVTCPNYILHDGDIIAVTFSVGNSANAISLDVNSTGAKAVYYNGAATSSTNKLIWLNDITLTFIYDGTNYHFLSRSKYLLGVDASETNSQIYLLGATEQTTDASTGTNSNLYYNNGLNASASDDNYTSSIEQSTNQIRFDVSYDYEDVEYDYSSSSNSFLRIRNNGIGLNSSRYTSDGTQESTYFNVASDSISMGGTGTYLSSITVSGEYGIEIGGGPVTITDVVTPTDNTDAANKQYVDGQVATKQDTLVSGTNIKTINNNSILGSGNLSITEGLEPLIGTTATVTPTQVFTAAREGRDMNISYTDADFGVLNFTAFNVAATMNVVISNTIVYYYGMLLAMQLIGTTTSNTWELRGDKIAQEDAVVTDVQINGTSITSSGVANIVTNTAYNALTNKIATMSDVPVLTFTPDESTHNLTISIQ